MTSGGERGAAVRHAQRATGQASALAAMIASERPFTNVAQQLLAARGSLDSLLIRLVELELRDCVPNPEAREEIDGLLRTALGRAAYGRHPVRPHRSRTPAEPTAALVLEGTISP